MTSHTYMAEMALERFMADADGMEVLRLAREGLREGRWYGEYVSAIGQRPEVPPSSWPMQQIAAFAEVHALILGGSVAEVLIGVTGTPRKDVDREGNAAILSRLPHPFRAEVDMHQRNYEGDGDLFWDCPIPVSLSTGLIERFPDGTTHPLPIQFTIPPGRAVLEIGSTFPSRTWSHLIDRGGSVARWPYGCRHIRLMVNLDRESMLNLRIEKMMEEFRGLPHAGSD